MKKDCIFKNSYLLLTLTLFLLIGMLMLFPTADNYVNATNNDTSLMVVDASDTDDTAGATEQNDGEDGEADDTAGATEQKFDEYEPLPFEPVERNANNIILGGGFAFAVVLIGGAIVVDRRNGNGK